jgi:hypothetical protein
VIHQALVQLVVIANLARASGGPTWGYACNSTSTTAATTHALTVLSLDLLLSALGHHNTTCDTPGTGPAGGTQTVWLPQQQSQLMT